MIVLTLMTTAWMATGWTDPITLNSLASNFRSQHPRTHGPMVRPIGAGGGPLRGLRSDALDANWSGYVVTGDKFLSATATWTVPKVSYVAYPGSPQMEVSSTWVGIDGYGTEQLIQLGTEQDVSSSNVASYNVWWEVLPLAETYINATRFVVEAGDKITVTMQCTASCTPNAKQTWVLTMMNATRWKSPFTIQVPYATPLKSAEWIMEATCVSSCDSKPFFSYMPNFSITTFTGITVNNKNPNLVRSKNALMMTDPSGKAWGLPSDPIGGNSFSVSFVRPGST